MWTHGGRVVVVDMCGGFEGISSYLLFEISSIHLYLHSGSYNEKKFPRAFLKTQSMTPKEILDSGQIYDSMKYKNQETKKEEKKTPLVREKTFKPNSSTRKLPCNREETLSRT